MGVVGGPFHSRWEPETKEAPEGEPDTSPGPMERPAEALIPCSEKKILGGVWGSR